MFSIPLYSTLLYLMIFSPSSFISQEPMSCWPSLELNRACEWCSSPDFMRGVIEDYVHKPLDEWQELLLDLCYCYDCVQEYHWLADEAKQNNPRSALVKAHVIIVMFSSSSLFRNKDFIFSKYTAH